MLGARSRLPACGLLAALSLHASGAGAADKVRCTAAYEQSQELRRQDKLSAARSQLLVCEQACPKALASDCAKWQAEVEALMPTVRLRAVDAQGHPVPARVYLDGTLLVDSIGDSAVAVDSGDHVFRFEGDSGMTTDVHASLHGGERAREVEGVLAPPPPAAPTPAATPPIPMPTYVLGAVGLAALGIGGVLSFKGHLDAGHLQATCAPGCAPSDVDGIATLYDVAWVSAGVGVAALAVGLALWHPWRAATASSTSGLFVAPTPGGAFAGWRLVR